MRLEERRTVKIVLVLGALGGLAGLLVLPGFFALGMWLAPPLPVPATTPAPTLMRDALWARAEGGRAAELRAIQPINMFRYVLCSESAQHTADPLEAARLRTECQMHMPAMPALEQMSASHLRDAGMGESFRMGAARFATTISMSYTWTKEDLLNTLAERGNFGYGWRGADAAGRGYFGRPAAELDLSQAAFVAARLADTRTDPWCEPAAAASMRGRILQRMRENLAIDDAQLESASRRALALAPPPADRKPCPE